MLYYICAICDIITKKSFEAVSEIGESLCFFTEAAKGEKKKCHGIIFCSIRVRAVTTLR